MYESVTRNDLILLHKTSQAKPSQDDEDPKLVLIKCNLSFYVRHACRIVLRF